MPFTKQEILEAPVLAVIEPIMDDKTIPESAKFRAAFAVGAYIVRRDAFEEHTSIPRNEDDKKKNKDYMTGCLEGNLKWLKIPAKTTAKVLAGFSREWDQREKEGVQR